MDARAQQGKSDTSEISTGRGQRYFELLWRFYEKAGYYDKAALLLSRLADSENEDISLSQRFAYLSHTPSYVPKQEQIRRQRL
ncbi:hypothetical protein KIN20_028967 [Parelaphostrongylus tenuis]|uniref:Nucleoporin Nup133/Nup155-like C-terminal domain-containing protein n=1 Tax=Parelaphostrongylus tenuis TaxID=148309 RepID=A0AAD5R1Z0_PARTN|nr:hypothetical protein KIN20_028967 [Parelaphostrongylus tenuis]